MSKAMFSRVALALLFVSALSQPININPVIGIITQPTSEGWPYPPTVYSYIPASYVQFIESAGARAVPVPWDAYNLTDYLGTLNGVIIPGGSEPLVSSDYENLSPFGLVLKEVLDYVVDTNNKGTYYPIWGTCMGFEALSILISGNCSILEPCVGGINISSNNFINPSYNNSRLLSSVPSWLLQLMSTGNLSFFDHLSQVSTDAFQYNPQLAQTMNMVLYSYDQGGNQLISAFEGKTLPIYGTQFHQEKSPFEWRADLNLAINHSYPAVLLEQYLANFFVNECRKNLYDFDTDDDQWMLIYNYNASEIVQSSFTECYVFLNSNLTDVENVFEL